MAPSSQELEPPANPGPFRPLNSLGLRARCAAADLHLLFLLTWLLAMFAPLVTSLPTMFAPLLTSLPAGLFTGWRGGLLAGRRGGLLGLSI